MPQFHSRVLGAVHSKRVAASHQPLVAEDPSQRNEHGGKHQQIAEQAAPADHMMLAAQDDEDDASRRTGNRQPPFQVQVLVRKHGRADSEDHRHCSDHERGMAHGGETEAVKLHEKLQRNTEKGRGEQKNPFAAREARALNDEQQPGAGEEEAIENEVVDAEAREGNLAEEETEAPKDAGQRTSGIAEAAAGAARCDRRSLRPGFRTHEAELREDLSSIRPRHASVRNSRMAATPAAPACTQAAAFFSVTPPSAKSGVGFASSTAARRAVSPCPLALRGSVTLSNTGEKRSMEASPALRISSAEWQAALTRTSRPA